MTTETQESKLNAWGTSEEAGINWASDAIREAVSKSTPEECRFYLDSLRVMALQLLANDCFNLGLGIGVVSQKGVPVNLEWRAKRYVTATTNILHSIDSRVNQFIKLQKEGKLQMVSSKTTPIEEAINSAESNVVGIR